MEVNAIMQQLEALGTEKTKIIFENHGASEPVFGVRVGDMKKLTKGIKNNNELADALVDTRNYDAIYLAGIIANPKTLDKATLQKWMQYATAYMLSEYAVASVAASSEFALELAREWMKDEKELVVSGGYSTYSNYISITPNEALDLDEIRTILEDIKSTIQNQAPRVRYTMNGFLISVGVYVPELLEVALEIADEIGKVTVKLEKVSCQVPDARVMIEKVMDKDRIGVKRKNCRC